LQLVFSLCGQSSIHTNKALTMKLRCGVPIRILSGHFVSSPCDFSAISFLATPLSMSYCSWVFFLFVLPMNWPMFFSDWTASESVSSGVG
jgi:hypothetical protein